MANLGFTGGTSGVKTLPAAAGDKETRIRSLGWDDPLEEMATHSSILAWRIPWTKEPNGLHGVAQTGT